MPQTRQVNSSPSSPFWVAFLQGVLRDHPPQSAFALLRTLYGIARTLPRKVQGTEHAGSPSKNLCSRQTFVNEH